jgi:hypothetical protein
MKTKITVFLLCFVLSSPCYAYRFAEKWTKADTMYQGLFLAITTVDYLQTRTCAKNNWKMNGQGYYESNPFMSRYPSVREVDTLIPLAMLGHTFVSMALPPKATLFGIKLNPRRTWQLIWIGIEAGYVASNYSVGVRIEF